MIAGGRMNFIGDTIYDFGGFFLTNSAGAAAVLGGQNNRVSSLYAGIGAGLGNSIFGDYGVIGGGVGNRVGLSGIYSFDQTAGTIGGGSNNKVIGGGATIAGGEQNQAEGYWAAIAGGVYNQSSGAESAVLGGRSPNIAWSAHSVVLGGDYNEAGTNMLTGGFSLAAGRARQSHASGSLRLGDPTHDDVVSTNANSITFRATGGVRIFSS